MDSKAWPRADVGSIPIAAPYLMMSPLGDLTEFDAMEKRSYSAVGEV